MTVREESLADRVVAITGAGSGVGRATAVAVAAEGAVPVLLGRHVAPLQETKRLLGDAARSLVITVDVSDEEPVNAAFAQAVAELGGIDAAILAAGVGRYGPVESYSLDDWEATLGTNLTGPFLCARAVIPHLRQRGGGHIIAISSGAGKQGYPELAAYSASKFGLMGLMQGMAGEVSGDGIKVSAIVPGSILTPFGNRSLAEKQQQASESGRKYLEPEDLAEAVLFLLQQPRRAWTQELNLWPF